MCKERIKKLRKMIKNQLTLLKKLFKQKWRAHSRLRSLNEKMKYEKTSKEERKL